MKLKYSLLGLCLASLSATASGLDTAIQAFKDGKFDEARTAFEAAKDSPEAQLYLARIAHRQGKLDEAEEAFEALAKSQDQNPELHIHWGALLCAQAQNASMFSALGYAKDCKAHFERAVALKPDSLDYRNALFDFYLGAPGIAGGGADKAKKLIADAEKLDPAHGLMMKGRVAQAEENYAEAENLMKQAIEKAPGRNEYRMLLGFMYQAAKRYDQAVDQFAALVKAKPDAMSALYQIGRSAVLGKTRLAEGEQAIREYLKRPVTADQPSHGWAHLRLAQIYELMGKKADSAKALDQAQALAGDDERLLDKVKEARG